MRSVPIRDEGGLAVGDDRIVPRLMLVGRNAEKLAAVAKSYGAEWTTDLDKALADPAFTVFFDAAATSQRQGVLEKAIAAGKHIYSEKPVALSVDKGLELLRAIKARGLKHGAVEDKLGLPGLQKLATARGAGISSAASPGFASSSAGGCSTAPRCRASGRAGTTAGRTAAG